MVASGVSNQHMISSADDSFTTASTDHEISHTNTSLPTKNGEAQGRSLPDIGNVGSQQSMEDSSLDVDICQVSDKVVSKAKHMGRIDETTSSTLNTLENVPHIVEAVPNIQNEAAYKINANKESNGIITEPQYSKDDLEDHSSYDVINGYDNKLAETADGDTNSYSCSHDDDTPIRNTYIPQSLDSTGRRENLSVFETVNVV